GVVEKTLSAQDAPVSLEELGTALGLRWPRDGATEPQALARLLCEILGVAVREHRRVRGAWVDAGRRSSATLLGLAAGTQRLVGFAAPLPGAAARRELAAAVAAAMEAPLELGLRDLRHLAQALSADEPRGSLEEVGEAIESQSDVNRTSAESVLARWIREGQAPPAPGDGLERCASEGAILGWAVTPGSPHELVRSGLLFDSETSLPASVSPRGLRKAV